MKILTRELVESDGGKKSMTKTEEKKETEKQYVMDIIRHSSDMLTDEYLYKTDFRFQRTQRHGLWFVTYKNHLITFGQYRNDLEE
jgi:hypothetical protein